MNRRKAREYALQMLFQYEFTGNKKEFISLDDFRPDKKEGKGLKKFADELVKGTLENLDEIDRLIQQTAENWEMKRMAAVDRNILRCAVYELLYRKDIPPAVTINEALEIAKKFSSLESVPFINGLLDKIASNSRKTQ